MNRLGLIDCNSGTDLGTQGSVAWTNPTFLVNQVAGSGPDGNFATANLNASSSKIIRAGFPAASFAGIPDNNQIYGVEFHVWHLFSNAGVIQDVTSLPVGINLVLGGVRQPVNRGRDTQWPIATPGEVVYGGLGDTWGLTTAQLNPTTVKAAGFALDMAAIETTGIADVAEIDAVEVYVYYDFPTTAQQSGRASANRARA